MMFGAEAGKSSAWGLVGLARQLVILRFAPTTKMHPFYYSNIV